MIHMTEKQLKEQKEIWRLRWLGMIYSFSHLKYLRGLWIEGRYPNEIGIFAEDMCKYFDDLTINDNYELRLTTGDINQEEWKIIGVTQHG